MKVGSMTAAAMSQGLQSGHQPCRGSALESCSGKKASGQKKISLAGETRGRAGVGKMLLQSAGTQISALMKKAATPRSRFGGGGIGRSRGGRRIFRSRLRCGHGKGRF